MGVTSKANAAAQRLCDNYAKLGFYNRGVKYNSNYYEMRHIDAPNVIFEICFCDSAKDIANTIDPNIPFKAEATTVSARYQVRIYAFNEKEAKEASQIITKEHGWYNVVEKI